MDRKDFKKITNEHFEICEKIIENNGDCSNVKVDCKDCPFGHLNAINEEKCHTNYGDSIEETLEVAKEFLKFRPNLIIPKGKINKEELAEYPKVCLVIPDDENTIRPNHYKLQIKGVEIEAIDIIREVTKDMKGEKAFNVGNVLKYVLRAEHKNGKEDYKKAKQYLEFLIGE